MVNKCFHKENDVIHILISIIILNLIWKKWKTYNIIYWVKACGSPWEYPNILYVKGCIIVLLFSILRRVDITDSCCLCFWNFPISLWLHLSKSKLIKLSTLVQLLLTACYNRLPIHSKSLSLLFSYSLSLSLSNVYLKTPLSLTQTQPHTLSHFSLKHMRTEQMNNERLLGI